MDVMHPYLFQFTCHVMRWMEMIYFGGKIMNADLNIRGHQTKIQRSNVMETITIKITIQGIVVTIMMNMDMFVKTA